MVTEAGASARQRYRSLRHRRWRRLVAAAAVAALAALAVVRGWPPPVAVVLAAVAVTTAATAVAGEKGRDLDRWRRGAAGERLTAAVLESLSPRLWSVWHDLAVPGSPANLDHLVAGPTGVWLIDSKATRAPVEAGWRSVRVGGRRLDVEAVRWEAETVAAVLETRLGRPVRVRPLVALHAEGLARRGVRCRGVRIVPAAEVAARVRRGRRRLGRAEIREVCQAVDVGLAPRRSR